MSSFQILGKLSNIWRLGPVLNFVRPRKPDLQNISLDEIKRKILQKLLFLIFTAPYKIVYLSFILCELF